MSNEVEILNIPAQAFKERLHERVFLGLHLSENLKVATDYSKYQTKFNDWDSQNRDYIFQSVNPLSGFDYGFEYMGAAGYLLDQPSQSKLENLKEEFQLKIEFLKRLIDRVELPKSGRSNDVLPDTTPLDLTRVFIVHGHDDLAKQKVGRFIERLGFTPIILHEQSNSGRTIIEKIEKYSNVGFAIVIYTPCDVGGIDRDSLKPRARQNVIFEHGYLIGKIGRGNVSALVKGDIETPTDISGVAYTHMDDYDGWQNIIAMELRDSHYPVDMNKIK